MTKIALITGASRGLGAALAEALATDHHVVAVGRTVGALEDLDDRIQATIDTTQPNGHQKLQQAMEMEINNLNNKITQNQI